MTHPQPAISNFRLVHNHPYLRALADITLGGFVVRGLKLEEGAGGQLFLGFPGRKVQGSWQLICDSQDIAARDSLLSRLAERYHGLREAA